MRPIYMLDACPGADRCRDCGAAQGSWSTINQRSVHLFACQVLGLAEPIALCLDCYNNRRAQHERRQAAGAQQAAMF